MCVLQTQQGQGRIKKKKDRGSDCTIVVRYMGGGRRESKNHEGAQRGKKQLERIETFTNNECGIKILRTDNNSESVSTFACIQIICLYPAGCDCRGCHLIITGTEGVITVRTTWLLIKLQFNLVKFNHFCGLTQQTNRS